MVPLFSFHVNYVSGKGKHVDWYRAFREALQNPDAGQDVKKRYKVLVEFLDNTVIHRPQSQGGKFGELQLTSDSMRLPHYQALPNITSSGAQNVLNLEEERKQEEEMVMKELREEDKFSVWSGKFERSNSLTLIKGYFQQWIPTPDNFSSLIVVSITRIQTHNNSFFHEFHSKTCLWP